MAAKAVHKTSKKRCGAANDLPTRQLQALLAPGQASSPPFLAEGASIIKWQSRPAEIRQPHNPENLPSTASEAVSASLLPQWQASLEAAVQARPSGSVLAVNMSDGEWRETSPELPWNIKQPDDLQPGWALLMPFNKPLKAILGVTYGFCLNWVGETGPGKLEAHLGVFTNPKHQALVDVSAKGDLVCQIERVEDQLRVAFYSRKAAGLDFAVAAHAVADSSGTTEDEELVAALAGVHPQELAEALAEKSSRGRCDQAIERLLELWPTLDSGAAAVIWRATGDEQALQCLRFFTQRLAREASDILAVRTILEEEITSSSSPSAAWLEATAGSLLAPLIDPRVLERLKLAAQAAFSLLRDEELLAVLGRLKASALSDAARILESGVPPAVRELARALTAFGLRALERRIAADLGHAQHASCGSVPLAECWFQFTEAGLASYRAALQGDLTVALNAGGFHSRIGYGVLTHGLRRQNTLEVHLPFLQRGAWSARLEALSGARPEATLDGRVFVYLAGSGAASWRGAAQPVMSLCGAAVTRPHRRDLGFRLGWSDKRRFGLAQARWMLPPILAAYGLEQALAWLEEQPSQNAQVEVELALSVPGQQAAVWLEAPLERTPRFGPTYTEMSVSVQQALRLWLPYIYFTDLTRYETASAAYPLVVYQCTLPFRSKTKNEFAYDVMSAESVAVARRSTAWALGAELARIEQLLMAAGKAEVARLYRPSRKDIILAAVERSPRLLNSLLVADALFIDQLIRLALRAGGLRQALDREPQRAVRELVKFSDELAKAFERRLRRLYGCEDFAGLAPLILIEATRGLNLALRSHNPVSAVLDLSVHDPDGRLSRRLFASGPQ